MRSDRPPAPPGTEQARTARTPAPPHRWPTTRLTDGPGDPFYEVTDGPGDPSYDGGDGG